MYGKRHELLLAATQLFAEEGLGVSTARIAKVAGVASGTLFTYFPTKQALLDELYMELKKEVIGLFLGVKADRAVGLKDISEGIWNAYIRWAMANAAKNTTMNLLKSSGMLSAEVVAQAMETFKPLEQMIQQGIDAGVLAPIEMGYLQLVMAAQIDACIAQAKLAELKGKALEAHLGLGFRVFWKGVAA